MNDNSDAGQAVRIQAFSEGKDLDAPDANEDQLVVLPGRGYAVIDGVTDITGRTFDGVRAGRLASNVVQAAVSEWLCAARGVGGRPEELIGHVNEALRATQRRHGLAAQAADQPRVSATLTVALRADSEYCFILVGDSGLRLNGHELWINDSGLDLVTASLRVEAYRLVAEAGGKAADQARVGRACAFFGAAEFHPDMAPWLDVNRLRSLYERSLAWCLARFPSAPLADIRRLLDNGVRGQPYFQNNTVSPFSYAVLDGTECPMSLVKVIRRPLDGVQSIELFTDGYFEPGRSADVASWEASFEEVERIDPAKIDRYRSVKGSTGRVRTDDRTVVIVHPKSLMAYVCAPDLTCRDITAPSRLASRSTSAMWRPTRSRD
jgi:hypothetical protein